MSSPAAAPAAPGAPVPRGAPEAPAAGRIRSRVPNTRALHVINPFVSAILRSPFHRVLSRHVLLLTYTGRKTRKTYTIPVGYMREGNTFTIVSAHQWWKSVRGGAPVEVLLQGRRRLGHAEVIEDRATVLTEVDRLVARYGRTRAGHHIGVALDTTPPPSREELEEAMRGRVVIRLRLDGETEQGEA